MSNILMHPKADTAFTTIVAMAPDASCIFSHTALCATQFEPLNKMYIQYFEAVVLELSCVWYLDKYSVCSTPVFCSYGTILGTELHTGVWTM
jgi:hypothetical protein